MRRPHALVSAPVRLIVLLAVAAPSADARAGGFEFPDNGARALGRGGAFVARADDPTAIYHNPSGITRLNRPTLLVDLNLSHSDYRFRRAPTERTTRSGQRIRLPEEGGFEEIDNAAPPFPAPFLSYVHPLSSAWTLAAGIYGPSAYGWREFPEDGPQRYELTRSEILLTYTTLAVGWRSPTGMLRLGASLQAASVPKMHIELKTDGDPGIITTGQGRYTQSEDARWDNKTILELTRGFIPTGILGATVAPTDNFELGVSYRPGFELETFGEVSVEYSKFFFYDPDPDDPTRHNAAFEAQCADAAPEERFLCSRDPKMTDDGASLRLNFPHIVRAGLRYVDRPSRDSPPEDERWDIELDVSWERWSTLKDITVEFDGELVFNTFIATQVERRVPLKDRPIVLTHDWQDVLGVRLGGDWRLSDSLTVRGGVSYETSTFPSHAVDLLAEGFPKATLSVGGSYDLTDSMRLSAGLMTSMSSEFESRNSQVVAQIPLSECVPEYEDASKCPYDGEPTGNPIGAGTYNNRITVFSLGLTAGF